MLVVLSVCCFPHFYLSSVFLDQVLNIKSVATVSHNLLGIIYRKANVVHILLIVTTRAMKSSLVFVEDLMVDFADLLKHEKHQRLNEDDFVLMFSSLGFP